MFNAKLIQEGFARVYTYKPDVKYNDFLLELQRRARETIKAFGVNK